MHGSSGPPTVRPKGLVGLPPILRKTLVKEGLFHNYPEENMQTSTQN